MAFFAGAIVGDLLLNTSGFSAGFSIGLGIARAGVAALKDAIGTGIELAVNAEQAEVAFSTFLGGARQAKAMLAEISAFAAATPFESPELVGAARQMLGFGMASDQVMPTLKMLGDVAAGTQQPIGRLAYLFGTAAAAGKLATVDMNQFAMAGIPIWGTMQKMLGVTRDELKKMAEEGKIDSGLMTRAFEQMTGAGGLYENMMQNQSATVGGLWSTLKDTLGQALKSIGDAILSTFDVKGGLNAFIAWAESVKPAIISGIGSAIEFVLPLAKGFWEVLKGVGQLVGGSLMRSFVALGPILQAVGNVLAFLLESIGKVLQGIATVVNGVTSLAFGPTPSIAGAAAGPTPAGTGGRGAQPAGGFNVTVSPKFDPAESAMQFADKVVPVIQSEYERQGREMQGAAQQQLVARSVGGR